MLDLIKGFCVKLKLETDNEITILTVTESIEPMHIAILKAGLKKLFAAEKRTIIIDFNNIPVSVLEVKELSREILTIPDWAQEQGAQIQITSGSSTVQTAANRAEAAQAMKSPLSKLQQLETKLNAQIKALEQQKIDISQKVDSSSSGIDFKALRKENSNLKKQIRLYEEAIQRHLLKRSSPFESGALKIKQEHLKGLLQTVMEQEGTLPVKTS